ncbi:unnamed protein product [Plutella xylostella]|uniref:Exocyst complex component 2 n=1 Tax=Plutella xylostella TaxID=51655 RepID=A0A8S4DT05_PLUXY|nr:unnamed protein product [Plutella xylostella]
MGPPPVVTGISPKEGPPGTRVTIRGEFLGTSATDLIGLKICGCDCLLSAEWKSKNKIIARSGPCKGRGDIIVTTRSGGEGTSTVQFRGYHESIGPVKESAVWVEESAPLSLPWGRRPMSPTTYTPPDPLGLSTEGDDCKFPEEELHELYPDGSGNLSDENFEPGWYLLEHHSNTSYEDLKAGMVFLQRKVEGQKEGQLHLLKANTGAVMEQLDRLVLLKNMFEEDERKAGREPLPSLQAAIEESITLADSLFSEILSRKDNADKTREALSLLTRHKFLFQLPANIDKNIKKKDYDLVVNDYARVKNLFGNTDVKLFQKILTDIDRKIDDLKTKLREQIQTMPINIQDQRKYIRLLISLNWDGDAAWVAINSRKDYLMALLDKVKDHFKQKEEQEAADKGKRKSKPDSSGWSAAAGEWLLPNTQRHITHSTPTPAGKRKSKSPDISGWSVTAGEWLLPNIHHHITHSTPAGKRKSKSPDSSGWSAAAGEWLAAACALLAEQLAALWTLAKWYFAGELAGSPTANNRQEQFKQMIIESVELFATHMRGCLLLGGGGGTGGASGAGGGGAGAERVRARLVENLRALREMYEALIKLDLPSQANN